MTTAAQIRAVWAQVFEATAVKAITELSYNYDLIELVDQGIAQGTFDSLMLYNQEVNFFQYSVVKNQRQALVDSTKVDFIVDVSYVREVDTTGANYHAAQDCIETIHSAVDSVLGKHWGDLISGFDYDPTPPSIQLIKLSEADVWLSTYQFIGLS